MQGDPETSGGPHRPPGRVLRTPRRDIVNSGVRALTVNVILMALYWTLPLGERLSGFVAMWLGLALVGLIVLVGWELRIITRSQYPELRAVEAGAVALPVVLLPFAATYFSLAGTVSGSFGVHLTRLDALYFTITTFSTVGFGDIVPRSETTRAIVTGQIVVDLLLIGFIAKAIVGTAHRRRRALADDQPD